MIKQDIITKGGPHRWQKGESGNAAGRPIGSRQKIADRALSLVNDLIHTDAATASLRELMANDAGKFWTIVAGLLPRELEAKIRVQMAPTALSADEYDRVRGVLAAIENAGLGDVPPAELFGAIESFLRSEFARTIEHAPALIEHQAAVSVDPSGHPEPIAVTIPAPPF
jgi:hypothetical protein